MGRVPRTRTCDAESRKILAGDGGLALSGAGAGDVAESLSFGNGPEARDWPFASAMLVQRLFTCNPSGAASLVPLAAGSRASLLSSNRNKNEGLKEEYMR